MSGFFDDDTVKNKNADTEWDQKQTDKLLDLYLAGTPPKRLAQLLERSPKAIERRLNQFTYDERDIATEYKPAQRVSRKGKRMTENERVLLRTYKEKKISLKVLAKVLMREVKEMGVDGPDLHVIGEAKKIGTGVDLVLAYRYLYYCKGISILSDAAYDAIEKEEIEFGACGHLLKTPGSDNPDSYHPHIRALAIYLAFKHGQKAPPSEATPPSS